ncbi:MAG: HAD family hydrolase [Planctomycetaceae bacterium]
MTDRVIFFDIDGTLLSSGGAGQLALERALVDEFRVEFPFEGVLTAGRTDRGITDEIFQRYHIDNTPENRIRFRDAYLTHLQSALECSAGRLLPGVAALLDQLTTHRHLTLSLLTGNYAEGARIKLRHYKLDHFFTFGGFGDDDADRDNVARNALTAAGSVFQRELNGAHTLVIGDTPADIRCARAIGARCIAVATGTYGSHELQPHAPDHVFEDFSATATVVSRVLELL